MDAIEAVAEPNRRRIVEIVAGGARNAGSIAADFAISRSAVSQHLAVLVEAQVLEVQRHGTQRIYSLNVAAIAEAQDWLGQQAERWRRSIDALEGALDRGEL